MASCSPMPHSTPRGPVGSTNGKSDRLLLAALVRIEGPVSRCFVLRRRTREPACSARLSPAFRPFPVAGENRLRPDSLPVALMTQRSPC